MEIPSKIYVVVANERLEVSPSELDRRLDAGEVTLDTLAWFKGMENWAPIRDMPELLAFLGREAQDDAASPAEAEPQTEAEPQAEAAAEPVAEEPALEARDSMDADDGAEAGFEEEPTVAESFDASAALGAVSSPQSVAEPEVASQPDSAADEALLGMVSDEPAPVDVPSDEGEAERALFGGSAAAAEEDDIFASAKDDLFGEKPLAPQRETAEKAKGGADMVWQRHETSVLFSLSDVREVKEKDARPKSDEGVIDIRAIASQASRENEGIDRIIAGWERGLGDGPAEAGASIVQGIENVDAPLIKKRSNTALLALIGVLVVVIVGLVALIFLRGEPKDPVAPAPAVAVQTPAKPVVEPAKPVAKPAKPVVAPAAPAAEPGQPAAEPGKPAAEPGQPAAEPGKPATEPGKPAAEPAKPDAEPAKPAPGKPAPGKPAPAKPAAAPAKPAAAPAKPAAEPAKPTPAKTNDADDILASIGSGTAPRATGGSVTGGGALPTKLSAAQKKKAMDAVSSKVQSCFARFGNPAALTALKVKMTIGSEGDVRQASIVSPGVAGTPQGNCVEGVLKKVTFEPFKASTDYVHYSYRID